MAIRWVPLVDARRSFRVLKRETKSAVAMAGHSLNVAPNVSLVGRYERKQAAPSRRRLGD